jgi:DNA repair exonuclease SbcCD ATPase subunit
MPAKKRPQVDQAQKRREELAALQEQLSGLQKKLLEKDEALRSAENLIGRISAANEAVEELRGQLSEKESLIESTGSELHGAKVQRLLALLCISFFILLLQLDQLCAKISVQGSTTHATALLSLEFQLM